MKLHRLFALLCAVILSAGLLAGCAGGPTVATVGGEAITVKELNMFANFILLQQQAGVTVSGIDDAESLKQVYADALDTAITYKVLMKKGIDRKFYPLSEEKRKEIDDQIAEYLEGELAALVEQYKQAGSTQAEADTKARKESYAAMEKSGLTRQNLTLILRYSAVAEMFYNEIVDAATVSDADLQAGYDRKVAEQKDQFAADPAAYEQAKAMEESYGSPAVLYKPEGFRYVKHILISFPEEVSTKIQEAQYGGDADAVKKLRNDSLPLIQAKADEVLQKVNSGSDFDALMAEYGQDPGMQADPEMTTGYMLGQSTGFVEEFKEAALKLGKVGDVTGLVASDYGYHIIKWVGNVPSGAVPLEDVKDALMEELLTEKQDEAWKLLIDGLKAEYKVQEFPDKFPMPSAAATVAPPAEG